MNRLVVPLVILSATATGAFFARPLAAQSLSGSRASVDRMYRHAVNNGIYFYKTGEGIRRAGSEGRFVRLNGNANYTTHAVSYPFVRVETRTFVERLAAQYRAACGEQLVVTSATRPESMHLRNSVDKSVHPTGMAIDLRRSAKSSCRAWLRRTLIALEGTGVIEATEERRPPHFHVAVYPAPYTRYVSGRGSTTADATRVATSGGGGEQYRVRRGDSLWNIARRHDTTVDALMAINGLDSSRLMPGQTLRIP